MDLRLRAHTAFPFFPLGKHIKGPGRRGWRVRAERFTAAPGREVCLQACLAGP